MTKYYYFDGVGESYQNTKRRMDVDTGRVEYRDEGLWKHCVGNIVDIDPGELERGPEYVELHRKLMRIIKLNRYKNPE